MTYHVTKTAFTLAEGATHVALLDNYRKNALTFAVVLITLGVIGIVAAITLPTLISNHKDKEYSVKLKKIYSIMSTAFNSAINDNGTVDTWGLTGSWNETEENQNIVIDKIAPYLKISSRCQTAANCSGISYETKYLDGSDRSNVIPRVVLADGTVINTIYIAHSLCLTQRGEGPYLSNVCGNFDVDLNGPKPPNTLGKDIFSFYYTKNGFYPKGTQDDTAETFDGRCLGKTGVQPGQGCTAWVIYNENMDYTKCNDLSWDGKTKCKE